MVYRRWRLAGDFLLFVDQPQPDGHVGQLPVDLVVGDGDGVPHQECGGLEDRVQVGERLLDLSGTGERPEGEGEPVVDLRLLQDTAPVQRLAQPRQTPEGSQQILQRASSLRRLPGGVGTGRGLGLPVMREGRLPAPAHLHGGLLRHGLGGDHGPHRGAGLACHQLRHLKHQTVLLLCSD